MSTHVRAAVIGGGVVGCSVLYHLTKRGWSDVALLERTELTAGSTWHAAGGMHTLNGDPNVAALQKYTIELYEELERIDGTSCGVHRPGCVYLAATAQELDFFRVERAKARYLGLELDFISLGEVTKLNPLLDTSQFIAAMFDPNDGHVDPSGVTQAMAKGARDRGAKVVRQCPVLSVRRRLSGEWEIETPKGSYVAEYVINAAGLWAREVGRMFGAELPIVPMEHQYVVTNDIPELAALGREIPVGVDFSGANYFRQERHGLLLGTYEQDCRHWAVDGTPADFGVELLPADLERISAELHKAMERIPVLAQAGIKRVVNGGMVFSPDGNPIIGALPDQPTAFVAAGCMAGFSQSGGVGLAVANWIVDGEPGMDVHAMDIARYGEFATRPYVLAKTAENYRRRFIIASPNEELQAARPHKISPIHDRLTARGALFGQVAGREVPLWFAGRPEDAHETPSFRRSNAFEPIGAECQAVRNAVGLWETSSYCKIDIRGSQAAAWLDTVVANPVPAVGRIGLSPILTPSGRILGDVSIVRIAEDRLLLMGSPAAETTYLRWLHQHCIGGVDIRSATDRYAGLSLTGPRARDVLAAITDDDISAAALPFMHMRWLKVGAAHVLAMRISFTGELGFELYMPPEHEAEVYERLRAAGGPIGLRDFGVRALNSLRLEKGYGGWGREFTQDVSSAEAGVQFIRGDKPQFIGRAATRTGTTPPRRLALLKIFTEDVDPAGGEPVLSSDRPVARLTSGAHSYTFGHGLGLAYLPADAVESTSLAVEILGRAYAAQVLPQAPYDPRGARIRA